MNKKTLKANDWQALRTEELASELHQSLDQWFQAGHSRFAMALVAKRSGKVLVATDRAAEGLPPQLIERQVISMEDGRVCERIEKSINISSLAEDFHNAQALIDAVKRRLAGEIAPPHICPKLPQNIRRP